VAPALHRRLKLAAVASGLTMQEAVTAAVEAWLRTRRSRDEDAARVAALAEGGR
jgi:hypothetical protein